MKSKFEWPPRLELALLPTRIHPLRQFDFPGQAQVWMKRDDETGFSLSGNKIRKLEFSLAKAVALGVDGVITCGGMNSNHCRATTFAASQLALDCHLVLRSPNGKAPVTLQGNTLLNTIAGAQINWISPQQYSQRNEIMEQHRQQLAAEGLNYMVIPEGASDALGSLGYVYAMQEYAEQCEFMNLEFDWLMHPMGSAGTAAGLTAGRDLLGLPCKILGVPVCDDSEYFLSKVREIRKEMEAFGLPSFEEEFFELEDSYTGSGYGLTGPEELKRIAAFCQAEGVLLDPCYTGKAMDCLCGELAKGRFAPASKILFWHTGGALGNFSYEDQWSQVLKR